MRGSVLELVRALQFLGADVEQLHPRPLQLEHHPRISRAHHRELDEIVGVALGIGAEIEHDQVVVAERRQQSGERRPVDPGHGAKRQLGHRHHRPGIAAGDHRLRLAVLHRGDGEAHGRGLGAADRLAGLVVAGNDVVAMDDLAHRGERRMARQLGPDRRLVAEQQEGEVVAALKGQGRAGDHHRRAGIATHRVDRDPRGACHLRRLPF